MNTSREISTISYNSAEFLKLKLRELYDRHLISNYMYIGHYKEEDESKDHWHLWIKPNHKIDTMTLQEMFREPDPTHDRPLGCIDFETSKYEEWIPYVLHDKGYLRYKHESRVYSYSKDDMLVADPDTYYELYRKAFRSSKWSDKVRQMEKLNNPDLQAADLIENGTFDFMQASQLLAYERLCERRTYRNGRSGHEDNTFCRGSGTDPDSQ